MDPFLLLLTPIVLLAIVALFAFVGCSFRPSSASFNIATATAGTSTITLPLNNTLGGELLVVTVQWGGAGKPVFTPNILNPIAQGGPFAWNGMQIQSFSVVHPQNNPNIVVELQDNNGQPVNSPVQWNVLFAAFRSSDGSPFFGGAATNPALTGATFSSQPVTVDTGQAVYAVAFAADGGVITGAFPGNNALTISSTPAAISTGSNPVLFALDIQSAGQFTLQVSNSNTGPNPKGFIFVVGIKGFVNYE